MNPIPLRSLATVEHLAHDFAETLEIRATWNGASVSVFRPLGSDLGPAEADALEGLRLELLHRRDIARMTLAAYDAVALDNLNESH